MTNKTDERSMWQTPWGYRESIAIVLGIIVVGFLLQLTIGSFNFYLLASPVNLILGGVMVLFCATTIFFRRKSFFKWFSGIPFSVSLIMGMLILAIIMGLTPQVAGEGSHPTDNVFLKLGFNQMTRSWAFILVYLVMLLSLGSLIGRRLSTFNWRDYGFHLNHIGLWLVLFAAGFGYADIERYIMHVREGETEWRVFDNEKNVKELPLAIHLEDFNMEEYPPKLTIIDRQSGIPQPESKPDYYQIDPKENTGRLNGWNIHVEEYIHQAVRNSDSTYREVPMPGATPAIRITAENTQNGITHTGWVCGGNQAQLYMSLALDDQYCIVMTQTEPKRFMSDVEVYTPNGIVKKAVLEVNKPIQIGSWTVYQYGYDNQAGRLSTYSSMELVNDPWKNVVFIGFALIALGTLGMIWNGKQLRRKYEDNNTVIEN